MRIPIPLLVLLVFCLTLTDADAAQGSADDRAQIVREFATQQTTFLKQRFDGNSGSKVEHPIVLIITAESAFLKGIKLNDPAIIIMPQADVVAAQLASFASLSKLEINGEHAMLNYEIPASDRVGEMRFVKSAGQWNKRSRNEIRSLASARAFYGKIYEGAVCRDETEMSYRWNYLVSRQAATYGGTCPGKTFPDVEVYRQQQPKAGG